MPGQGLLQKANLLQSEGLAFFDFISKHKIHICAFLNKFSSNYVITDSFGFDVDSYIKSVSSVDFWNGTITDINSVYVFNSFDNSINTVLQLFSENLKEKLTKVSVVRLSNNSIFILGNQELSKPIISDLCNINFESDKRNLSPALSTLDSSLSTFNFSLKITNLCESYISTFKLSDKIISSIIDSSYKEIKFQLFTCFKDFSSITSVNNYEYKISLQHKTDLPVELIRTHLISVLNDILPVKEELVSIIEE